MTAVNAPLTTVAQMIKRGVSPSYAEDGIVVLNQKCVRDNLIQLEPARRTSIAKKSVPEDKYLRQWDVVVNSTGVGTLGRVAQVKSLLEPTTVDSHVSIVRPDLSKVDGAYFGYAMVLNQPLIEAYLALVARRWAGRVGYKTDTKSKQTPEKEAARRDIVAGLRSPEFASIYGFTIDLPDERAEQFILDPSGDQLDSLLSAIQAGWAYLRRNEGYGVPTRCDVLEGWIPDPSMA